MGLAGTGDDVAAASRFTDVVIKSADGWQAHNLIWKSALRSLEEKLGKQNANDRPLDKRNVMIIGSGGLAVSIAHGVKRRNGLVSICSGDEVEAQRVASACELRFVPVAQLYSTLFDVVVITANTLDVGSKQTAVNPAMLRPGMTVMDLSELPGESNLTQEARERSCRVVEPAEIYANYVGLLFKSLTGQELPENAVIAGLSD
jgi:3-dehydroquinate dehydratase/shikimate dehydrogenase